MISALALDFSTLLELSSPLAPALFLPIASETCVHFIRGLGAYVPLIQKTGPEYISTKMSRSSRWNRSTDVESPMYLGGGRIHGWQNKDANK